MVWTNMTKAVEVQCM